VIDDLDGVLAQLKVWGWCVTGVPPDPAAALAEYGRLGLLTYQEQDNRAVQLLQMACDPDGAGWRPVPAWWGLYWVGEHVRRLGLEAEVLG
jgi:hypothetical protein